jgi:hypothetical protein
MAWMPAYIAVPNLLSKITIGEGETVVTILPTAFL